MSTATQTWYDFILAQISAESYLDDITFTRLKDVNDRLAFGANHYDYVAGFTDDEFSATRMTELMMEDFHARWRIVDHYPNDESGFSATLLKSKLTDKYTLSFRSTESKPASKGGDVERDGADGANGDIIEHAFAYAQIHSMNQYFENLPAGELKSGGAIS